MARDAPVIVLEGASRTHAVASGTVTALQPTDLTIGAGEFVVVLGPSGSGKTTLLNLIAGLDAPTQGSVTVAGQTLERLDREALGRFRREQVGLVFQFHNLVPNLTARENVELVADLVGRTNHVDGALEAVGLLARADHFPHEMSGGEQQRVAIARALVKSPPLILGDEPTGNLDATTGRTVVQLFADLHARGHCVVLVTHNAAIARVATRVLTMRDGAIATDVPNPTPSAPADIDW